MRHISFRRVARSCARAPQGASLGWNLILPEPLGETLGDGLDAEAPRSLGILEVHLGAHGLSGGRPRGGCAVGEAPRGKPRIAVAEKPVDALPAVPVDRLERGL